MIHRILVPIGARPPAPADAVTQRRRPTTMDERTLVPAMLPIVPLNGQSTIPTNLPLESIAARVVVPRDVSREAYGVREDLSTPLQPTDLDERITVPAGAAPPSVIEPMTIPPPADLVEPDIFTTGEVHLAVPEQQKEEKAKWQIVTRFSSVAFHVLLIGAILLQSKLFPPHEPTQTEIEFARNQLKLLLPPGAFEPSKPPTHPLPPAPKIKVDPRVLREVAPPIQPTPAPQPERPVKELPSAPVPKANAGLPESTPSAQAPKTEAPKPVLKLETPDAPQPQHGLILPKNSINRSLQDTIRETAKNPNTGGRSGLYSGPMPHAGGGLNGGAGGSQGSGGTFGNGYEILTPTEGVDFSDYMNRVVAAVRRNWYAVMPESAMLGDRGRVGLQFRIMKNGSVPDGEPVRIMGSGKEPLDRAAVSAIRSSNPFEPLPPAFSGPYIELRFIFLYNLPIEAAYQ
jgi:TonB family protein